MSQRKFSVPVLAPMLQHKKGYTFYEIDYNSYERGGNRLSKTSSIKPPPLADAKNLTARFSIVYYKDGDGELQPYDRSEDYFPFHEFAGPS